MKNKLIVIVASVVFGVGVIVYLGTSVIPKALVTVTRAAGSNKTFVNGSYLIGEKVSALNDGKDKAVVNVFVVDKKGLGVKGKRVSLNGMEGIEPKVDTSDSFGKVRFEITSKIEGQHELTAEIEGMTLPKTVKVMFRNK